LKSNSPRRRAKELTSLKAPLSVRHWIATFPVWLAVRDVPPSQADDESLKGIDEGERAAIQLASSLHADLLLMDDRKEVSAAQRKGLRVTGTLAFSTWRHYAVWRFRASGGTASADQFQNSPNAARLAVGKTCTGGRQCLNRLMPSWLLFIVDRA